MKHFLLFFFLFSFCSFSFHSYGQTPDFNASITLVEKALKDKDLTKAKNILSAEPLQSNQEKKKVQELSIKLSFLEKLLEGNEMLNKKLWDDAIIAAQYGIDFIINWVSNIV